MQCSLCMREIVDLPYIDLEDDSRAGGICASNTLKIKGFR
jgi:hypothetical protein